MGDSLEENSIIYFGLVEETLRDSWRSDEQIWDSSGSDEEEAWCIGTS